MSRHSVGNTPDQQNTRCLSLQ